MTAVLSNAHIHVLLLCSAASLRSRCASAAPSEGHSVGWCACAPHLSSVSAPDTTPGHPRAHGQLHDGGWLN